MDADKIESNNLRSDTHYGNLVRRHLFDQADFLPYRNRILA
jgi:hypothetical protein